MNAADLQTLRADLPPVSFAHVLEHAPNALEHAFAYDRARSAFFGHAPADDGSFARAAKQAREAKAALLAAVTTNNERPS